MVLVMPLLQTSSAFAIGFFVRPFPLMALMILLHSGATVTIYYMMYLRDPWVENDRDQSTKRDQGVV